MWLPGDGTMNGRDAAISKRRISGVRSRIARSVALRHATASGMLPGCHAGYGARLLGGEHAIAPPPRPKGARIDIEVIEGHARVAIDGTLLRLEDDVVLVVHALSLVDM